MNNITCREAPKMNMKDIIKNLRKFEQKYENQDKKVSAEVFCKDDKRSQAKEMKITLTERKISRIAKYLQHNIDPTSGMDWETLESAILYAKEDLI